MEQKIMEQTIFDINWFKKDDEFDKEEYEIQKRKIKRMFEVQYDKCEDLILEAKKIKRNMEIDRFARFDLNRYRENESDIQIYEKTKKEILELFEKFFGENLNR